MRALSHRALRHCPGQLLGLASIPVRCVFSCARHRCIHQSVTAAQVDPMAGSLQATAKRGPESSFDPDENWAAALGYLTNDGEWTSFVGVWTRFAPGGGADLKVLREYKGLRSFRKLGDDSVEQMNVYSIDTGGCEERQLDGNFSKTWTYNKQEHNKQDGWWHPFMTCEGPFRARVVAASPNSKTSVSCALPLQELKSGTESLPPLFAGEFFLRRPNEERSWSGSPMYNTETGQLMAGLMIDQLHIVKFTEMCGTAMWALLPDMLVYYISERQVAADPREAVDHVALGLPQSRPPLGPDVTQWLGSGSWAGKSEQIRWEPDGRMMRVWEVPAEEPWEPPRTDDAYQLSMLPDGMYMSYPKHLPTKAAEVPPEGVTIQMGGFTELDGSVFRRQSVHYGVHGHIESVLFEEWKEK